MKVNSYDISPRANLSGANLSGADLSGADLRRADLRRADLTEANLRWAYLTATNLRGANLRGADLSGADLRRANLSGADLSGADLTEADLRWADLTEARITYSSGVVRLPISDPRGYTWIGFVKDSEWRVVAGCRCYSLDKARQHWLDVNYDGPNEVKETVEFALSWLARQPISK